MNKRELVDKIEQALDMVITVGGRMFRIVRDEEDWLTITERQHKESEKHYSDTHQLSARDRIDGKPLRDCLEAITIVKYTALLDA